MTPSKAGQDAPQQLEADLQERPAAMLSEGRQFLEKVCGLRVSDSTVSRLLGWMGFA